MTRLGIYKCVPEAQLPHRATQSAACWDIHACVMDGARIQSYNSWNEYLNRPVVGNTFEIYPYERVLVPTGIIFDVPEHHSLRIHPRSGLSFKKGLTLMNCEGVVDSDYTLETFVSMINLSDVSYVMQHGERIAQVELVPLIPITWEEIDTPPLRQSNRQGGFGSTGG